MRGIGRRIRHLILRILFHSIRAWTSKLDQTIEIVPETALVSLFPRGQTHKLCSPLNPDLTARLIASGLAIKAAGMVPELSRGWVSLYLPPQGVFLQTLLLAKLEKTGCRLPLTASKGGRCSSCSVCCFSHSSPPQERNERPWENFPGSCNCPVNLTAKGSFHPHSLSR